MPPRKPRARWWATGAALVAALLVVLVLSRGLGSNPRPAAGTTAAGTMAGTTAAPSPKAAGSPGAAASPQPSRSPRASSSALPGSSAATPAPPAGAAQRLLASLSLEQKVGQVFMVAAPATGADADTLYALDDLHVGNVFLKGRSSAGRAGIGPVVAALAGRASGGSTGHVRPFVATDQEGGLVQVLSGPGFSAIPQAIVQGAQDPVALQADATGWGRELAAVGVNVNLAPVLDTVPGADFAPANAPIGAFGREYGYTPAAVSAAGLAFARGMLAAGVAPVPKHFPGLGRVTANTDTAAGVTDGETGPDDPFLAPFRDAVDAGLDWIMVSNADYPRLDPKQSAPFSRAIIHDLLRTDLRFQGLILSDDLCDAVQVSGVPVASRAVKFLRAGGTMALCTNQALMPQMYQGVLAAAHADPAFARLVDQAALAVLAAKDTAGLLPR